MFTTCRCWKALAGLRQSQRARRGFVRYVSESNDTVLNAIEAFRTANFADDLTDDFTSYADRCRFVNDLGRDQHIAFVTSLIEKNAEMGQFAAAACQDESAGFCLQEVWSGNVPLICVCRLNVSPEAGGKVDKLWARRPLFPDEAQAFLHDPAAYEKRLAETPSLLLREERNDEAARARMLAAIDLYTDVANSAGSAESGMHLNNLVAEGLFEAWEGTALWGGRAKDASGLLGVMEHHRSMCDARGPGRLRVLLRSHAASAEHNVAFAHHHFLGSARTGAPMAGDMLSVFVFDEGANKIQQIVTLRSPMSLSEYSLVFKLPMNIDA